MIGAIKTIPGDKPLTYYHARGDWARTSNNEYAKKDVMKMDHDDIASVDVWFLGSVMYDFRWDNDAFDVIEKVKQVCKEKGVKEPCFKSGTRLDLYGTAGEECTRGPTFKGRRPRDIWRAEPEIRWKDRPFLWTDCLNALENLGFTVTNEGSANSIFPYEIFYNFEEKSIYTRKEYMDIKNDNWLDLVTDVIKDYIDAGFTCFSGSRKSHFADRTQKGCLMWDGSFSDFGKHGVTKSWVKGAGYTFLAYWLLEGWDGSPTTHIGDALFSLPKISYLEDRHSYNVYIEMCNRKEVPIWTGTPWYVYRNKDADFMPVKEPWLLSHNERMDIIRDLFEENFDALKGLTPGSVIFIGSDRGSHWLYDTEFLETLKAYDWKSKGITLIYKNSYNSDAEILQNALTR
jgi:hypothetical protein